MLENGAERTTRSRGGAKDPVKRNAEEPFSVLSWYATASFRAVEAPMLWPRIEVDSGKDHGATGRSPSPSKLPKAGALGPSARRAAQSASTPAVADSAIPLSVGEPELAP